MKIAIKEKRRKLATEKKALYAKYRAAQQEMRQAVAVKTNIDYLLDGYIPAVEKMRTQLKKYSTAFTSTKAENEKLKKKNKKLSESLKEATHESVLKKLNDAKLQREYQEALAILERIPPDLLNQILHPDKADPTRARAGDTPDKGCIDWNKG